MKDQSVTSTQLISDFNVLFKEGGLIMTTNGNKIERDQEMLPHFSLYSSKESRSPSSPLLKERREQKNPH